MKIHVVSVNFLESWRCEIPRCEILGVDFDLGVDLGVDFEVDLGVDLRVDLGN